jgi:Ni,Fe-hydrogenase III large subunit
MTAPALSPALSPALAACLASAPPWPTTRVPAPLWEEAVAAVAGGRLTLSGLWGGQGEVLMALLDEERGALGVLGRAVEEGAYPSLALRVPAALRLERALRDLTGILPEGLPDPRPWLDHGRWPITPPLARSPRPSSPHPYPFLPAEGEGLHQIPVGPVHAGIIEPGHFRFTVVGETVVRLEERLGYVHRGLEALVQGASPEAGLALAGRVSGDSIVAYQSAYAQALEAASGLTPPPRARHLRALLLELERIANHLGDVGAIAQDAAFAPLPAAASVLREEVLRYAAASWGHRLMRDAVIPGGVARDLDAAGMTRLAALLTRLRTEVPRLFAMYGRTGSLADRTLSTGRTDPALVRRFGAGGFIGRAAGRGFDARRLQPEPYAALGLDVPVLTAGDVDARVRVRFLELEASLTLIARLLETLPGGPCVEPFRPAPEGEGVGMSEGFRGDVLVWVQLAEGRIARAHFRDPSWFQWPLLEAAIEGNIVADFPLCNKSFNCSYAGHDL